MRSLQKLGLTIVNTIAWALIASLALAAPFVPAVNLPMYAVLALGPICWLARR